MNSMMSIPSQLPTDSPESYLRAISHITILNAAEEQELAIRYRDENDLEAARMLVLSQVRFVVHVARGYLGYGLPFADLIQEGNIGLMKAVKRFDPTMNVRLISFAVHWIRAEIHEYIVRNWRIVKIATTKAQRKLFFNLRKSKKRLGWLNRQEVDTVAGDLGVDPKVVLEMEARLSNYDTAFDGYSDESEERAPAPAAYLSDQRSDPAAEVERNDSAQDHHARLAMALEALKPRDRDIVERRWMQEEKATLKELAGEYGVSLERIRQLEKAAFAKIRITLEA